MKRCTLLVVLLGLAGCTLGPDYERPEGLDVPEAFRLTGQQKPLAGPCAPLAVVLAPTHDLVEQLGDDFQRFLANERADPRLHVYTVAVHGGDGARAFDLGRLVRGADVLVATPARLWDYCRSGVVSLEQVKVLCLDEADALYQSLFGGRATS